MVLLFWKLCILIFILHIVNLNEFQLPCAMLNNILDYFK